MNIARLTFAAMCSICSPLAADVFTPAPGSEMRVEILDAVRVPATNAFGAPIEFHVYSFEVEGDVAFVRTMATRPGGAPIDLSQIPVVVRDGFHDIYEAKVEAFVKRVEGQWTVAENEYAIDPTDVWWIGQPYCTDYSAFIPIAACE